MNINPIPVNTIMYTRCGGCGGRRVIDNYPNNIDDFVRHKTKLRPIVIQSELPQDINKWTCLKFMEVLCMMMDGWVFESVQFKLVDTAGCNRETNFMKRYCTNNWKVAFAYNNYSDPIDISDVRYLAGQLVDQHGVTIPFLEISYPRVEPVPVKRARHK